MLLGSSLTIYYATWTYYTLYRSFADIETFHFSIYCRAIDRSRQISRERDSQVDACIRVIAQKLEDVIYENLLQTAMRALRIRVKTTEYVTEDQTITTVIVPLALPDQPAVEV